MVTASMILEQNNLAGLSMVSITNPMRALSRLSVRDVRESILMNASSLWMMLSLINSAVPTKIHENAQSLKMLSNRISVALSSFPCLLLLRSLSPKMWRFSPEENLTLQSIQKSLRTLRNCAGEEESSSLCMCPLSDITNYIGKAMCDVLPKASKNRSRNIAFEFILYVDL